MSSILYGEEAKEVIDEMKIIPSSKSKENGIKLLKIFDSMIRSDLNKEKVMEELFLELLNDWENNAETVINDRGCSEDYEELQKAKQEYLNRFYELTVKGGYYE